MSKTVKRLITLPGDWDAAFAAHCEQHGITNFSEFLCDAGADKLPASVRKNLSERRPAHRPRKES